MAGYKSSQVDIVDGDGNPTAAFDTAAGEWTIDVQVCDPADGTTKALPLDGSIQIQATEDESFHYRIAGNTNTAGTYSADADGTVTAKTMRQSPDLVVTNPSECRSAVAMYYWGWNRFVADAQPGFYGSVTMFGDVNGNPWAIDIHKRYTIENRYDPRTRWVNGAGGMMQGTAVLAPGQAVTLSTRIAALSGTPGFSNPATAVLTFPGLTHKYLVGAHLTLI